MINADRLLRIVYREQPLQTLLFWRQGPSDGTALPGQCLVDAAFELDIYSELPNERVLPDDIASRYLRTYPYNESPDGAELLIRSLGQELKAAFGSANAAYIYPLYAQRLFLLRSGEIQVRFEHLLEWDGFANKADAGIFYAAFCAKKNGSAKSVVTPVATHDNSVLYRILEKGYCENHMHLFGSGYSSEMNWVEFLLLPVWNKQGISILNANALDALAGRGKSPVQPERRTLAWQKVRILRMYLQALVDGNQALSQEQMAAVLQAGSEAALTPMQQQLDQLTGRLQDAFNALPDEPVRHIRFEQQFLADMFALLYAHALAPFERYLFNCYLAALCQFRFCFVQDNLGMGFTKFQQMQRNKNYFLKLRYGTKSSELIARSVFDKYYREKHVKKLEMRVAPMEKALLLQTVKTLKRINTVIYEDHLKLDPALEEIQWGIVIHYIKNEEKDILGGGAYRREVYRAGLDEESRHLSAFFELRDDEYKNRIVGIDAASYERNCPPELFAPLFRRHRYEISEKHRLHFTFHVGEDFHTLAGGLRAIAEVLEFLRFGRGDRLGHAVALGLDVEKYFSQKRDQITTTAQEYVDDIVWMHTLIQQDAPAENALLGWLRAEYYTHAGCLYRGILPQTPALHTSAAAWLLRADHPRLYVREEESTKSYQELCFLEPWLLNYEHPCHEAAFTTKVAWQLNQLYQHDVTLLENGSKPVLLSVHPMYAIAVALSQKLLRQRVYELDIAIETNPSSNRKITSVSRFIELPALAFNQHGLTPGPVAKPAQDMAISINTDDSAVFQTNLANEYALIAAALMREGYKHQEIWDYIEHLRIGSGLQSFIQ